MKQIFNFCDLIQASGHDLCSEDDHYTGNLSVTENGRMCQRWDAQEPHPHIFYPAAYYDDENYYFYVDGSAEAAENYCRTIGYDFAWCYTTDPEVKHEYCHRRLCNGRSVHTVLGGHVMV